MIPRDIPACCIRVLESRLPVAYTASRAVRAGMCYAMPLLGRHQWDYWYGPTILAGIRSKLRLARG